MYNCGICGVTSEPGQAMSKKTIYKNKTVVSYHGPDGKCVSHKEVKKHGLRGIQASTNQQRLIEKEIPICLDCKELE